MGTASRSSVILDLDDTEMFHNGFSFGSLTHFLCIIHSFIESSWSTRDTRAPHMAVHLCIVFNVIFIYISLVPRTNLVFDDEYNDYGA